MIIHLCTIYAASGELLGKALPDYFVILVE